MSANAIDLHLDRIPPINYHIAGWSLDPSRMDLRGEVFSAVMLLYGEASPAHNADISHQF